MNLNVDKMLLEISGNKPRADKNGLQRIGLKVPQVRAFVKEHFKYNESFSNILLNYWDKTWKNSIYFESMSAALYFYQHRSLNTKEIQKIKSWIERCKCWEHSDDLSKIFAQALEENPSSILPTFEVWNRSRNSWKRRQSVVG